MRILIAFALIVAGTTAIAERYYLTATGERFWGASYHDLTILISEQQKYLYTAANQEAPEELESRHEAFILRSDCSVTNRDNKHGIWGNNDNSLWLKGNGFDLTFVQPEPLAYSLKIGDPIADLLNIESNGCLGTKPEKLRPDDYDYEMSRCDLVVGQKTYANYDMGSVCRTRIDGHGLNVWMPGVWSATVSTDGDGYLKDKQDNGKRIPLGKLKNDAECWLGNQVHICARVED